MANSSCHDMYYEHTMPENEFILAEPSGISISKILLFAVLLLLKILGHFSLSVVIKGRGTIFANCIWFLCQFCIALINDLFNVIHWTQFILLQCIFCYLLESSLIKSKELNSGKKQQQLIPIIMGLNEIFWLITCNDISCIACYIFMFEGLFIQRLKTEFFECKWNDRHLWCFAFCKIIFCSWIYCSFNWIISFAEMLYFIVPILSLKYKPKFKLTFDQWFFIDGCSHISTFSFLYLWFISSKSC